MAGRVERYLEALRGELAERAADIPTLAASTTAPAGALVGPPLGVSGAPPRPSFFETIYVGGGTPTVLPAEASVALVREFAGYLQGPGAEFTVEANPGTIDADLLERLAGAGVTRLSLGVQSFSPALRATLGRRVTQGEIEGALAAIASTCWAEWNIDLMFGIPGQTWDDVLADIVAAAAVAPTHISFYDLTYTASFSAHIDATLWDRRQGGRRRLGRATLRAGGGEARSGRLPALRGVELRPPGP